MNRSDDSVPTVAMEEQASLWAARLDGAQLSFSQRRELDRWLEADPRHRPLLESYCRVSAGVEPVVREAAATGRIQIPDTGERRPLWWRLAPWLVAGSLAAAAAAWALLPARDSWEPSKYATAAAQRQQVRLPDGTDVELNASSALVLEEGRGERRARLVAGEAYFAVAKNPERPFLVETPAGVVRVTGTAFNVSVQRSTTLEVTVVEGSVQVSPGGGAEVHAPVQLKPGDRLATDGAQVRVTQLPEEQREAMLAWRDGRAVFVDVTLSEALATFGRYHGRALVAETAVGSLRVGGRYGLDDLEGFLSALEALLPVRVTRDLSGTIRVGPRGGS
ncbi:FecR family protein [Nibricoccus sp. IMCC34717]|uniref:FecR family protein n=1 Tax=Nibricoccus sp. IMCC34717 TaxID=3034021 RepID=UPI00384F1EE6